MNLTIKSFAYETGLPSYDANDRLYIFDCRTIRDLAWEQFGDTTGRDPRLIEHFNKQKSMQDFLAHIRTLLFFIENQARTAGDTRNTIIAFGCTHGKHRSVYCADTLAHDFFAKFYTPISVMHIEQKITYELTIV